MGIKIILADDHQIFREGLASLLARERDMQVVAMANDGREAVEAARKHNPDVVVMDITMKGMNGIEATRRIAASHPQMRILALSVHSDTQFIREMFQAGAVGFLLKDCAADELVSAIRGVNGGKMFLGRGIQASVVEAFVKAGARPDSPLAVLTPREREMLQLLAEGKSTKVIALALKVSGKTVESWRKNVMDKLDLHSIAELTKFAVRAGLTSL